MSKTSPSKIDSYIGHKLKLLRLKKNKSLGDIGMLLGVSFQQVQKYEKGTNKISSSNLYTLAEQLNTPLNYFFYGLEEQDTELKYGLKEDKSDFLYNVPSNISDQELVTLVKYYSRIKNPSIRKNFLELLKSL